MKDYKDLDALGKKARDAEKRLDCGKCPVYGNCYPSMHEACYYIFEQGFRKGYNKRKRESNQA